MTGNKLKVPKLKKKVKLWVHPEGQVIGSLFLHEESPDHPGCEEPVEALNQDNAFIVLERSEPEELRFYNRGTIIRVEYEQEKEQIEIEPINCQLNMMDGSYLEGTIRENLPPDYSRLYDYLNTSNNHFIKIYIDDNNVCLVNKSYINYATSN